MQLMFFSLQSVTGLPEIAGYIAAFIIGSLLGSFLNVVIHRVPRELSVVYPNSACPKCKNSIKPYDNIPVLSWLILGGKCRKCKTSISPRYPAVELLGGLVFVLVYSRLGFTWYLPVGLIFAVTMISLIFIDAEHMILPDVITFPLIGFALIVRFIFPFITGSRFFPDTFLLPLSLIDSGFPGWIVSLIGALLGALAGGGTLWLVGAIWKKLRGVDAMGFGDVKMMFGVGALLGWQLTILTIFIAAFSGSLVGAIVILKDREKGLQAKLPFGIFLGIGSIIAMLFGSRIIIWYFENFVPH